MGALRAKKFMPRAFRYVLRPQDQATMRYSLERTQGSSDIDQTILLNLSESGVAFLVTRSTRLRFNDSVKVEIPIPNGEQIAWWGRVVRLQEYDPPVWMFSKDPFHDEPKILVGVRFDQLPEGHTRTIRKGIEESFMQAMRDQQYRNWLYYKAMITVNLGRVAFFGGLIVLLALAMWALTRPSPNYDPKRGAPWGERFK